MKILVVDDEKAVRILLAEYLKMQDFPCITAKNGNEAVESIKLHSSLGFPFTLVITDTEMPKMEGVELVEWIKDNYSIPVILMSGNPEPRHLLDAFIGKPFDFKVVKALIKTLTT
jgi:DNA-binding response OmpR family regulator